MKNRWGASRAGWRIDGCGDAGRDGTGVWNRRRVLGGLGGLAAGWLGGCGTSDPVGQLEMDQPMMGEIKATTFQMQADGVIRLKDVVRVAKTIREQRRLNPAEQATLQQVVQGRFDGLKAAATAELKPTYERKRAAVVQQSAQKKAVAQQQAAAAGQPPTEAVARVAAEEKAAVAAIDSEWQLAAVDKIRSTYGTEFAVPVRSTGPEAAVAFASVDDRGVVRPGMAAYALDAAPDALMAQAATGRAVIGHQGKDAYVLNVPPTF